MVIVDTSIWIAFFNRQGSQEKVEVDCLLDKEEAMVVGPILTELIQGTRSEKELRIIKDVLSVLPYVEMTKATWELTGGIGLEFRRKGFTVATVDLMIAALAQEYGCAVYTLDSDFQRIPHLRLYTPTTY